MKLLLGVIVAVFSSANSFAQISNAKALELGLHRTEKLVILKKIDEAFQSKVKGLTIENLVKQVATDPTFKVIVSQYPGADGKIFQLELMMDENGKTLTYNVVAGSAAQGAPAWPDKDPLTLAESALHYVIEGSAIDSKLKPYNDVGSSIASMQGTDAQGKLVAAFDIRAKDQAKYLRILIKPDGTFQSAEFLE